MLEVSHECPSPHDALLLPRQALILTGTLVLSAKMVEAIERC